MTTAAIKTGVRALGLPEPLKKQVMPVDHCGSVAKNATARSASEATATVLTVGEASLIFSARPGTAVITSIARAHTPLITVPIRIHLRLLSS